MLPTKRAIPASQCRISFQWNEGMPIATLAWGERAWVRAVINIENDEAVLDIHHVAAPHSNPILAFFGSKADYRGRGLGSLLLRHVSRELKEHGVRVLRGRVKGQDEVRLRRWYRREGFRVDDVTNEIYKVL